MSDYAQLRTSQRRARILDQTIVKEIPIYDEGTFPPTYFGATTAGVTTYTTQEGIWTRCGRVVSVQGKIVWTNATGTGVVRLGGLPFTALYDVAFAVRTVNVTFANGSIQGILQAANAVAQLFSPATNAAGTELAIEVAGSLWYQITFILT